MSKKSVKDAKRVRHTSNRRREGGGTGRDKRGADMWKKHGHFLCGIKNFGGQMGNLIYKWKTLRDFWGVKGGWLWNWEQGRGQEKTQLGHTKTTRKKPSNRNREHSPGGGRGKKKRGGTRSATLPRGLIHYQVKNNTQLLWKKKEVDRCISRTSKGSWYNKNKWNT